MKNYKVTYSDAALRQLEKLDPFQSKTIAKWVTKNLAGTSDPRQRGKALGGNLSGYWRYRIGDYRIVCIIHDDICEVIVVKAGHRSRAYS